MSILLETNKLTKKYLSKQALRDVSLKINEGTVLGLLGPNGSGKTTFMKIAAGLIKPTSGEIKIMGHHPGVESKSLVSYLPDVNHLYRWMTIKDAVDFYRDLYHDFDAEKCIELLDFMKLDIKQKVTSLSKGMYEKSTLALALSRNAKLYIFDEPLGGIDPVARDKIIDAIINNYRQDCSFIISTHLVKDIERLFDEVAFIADGQIVMQGNAEELRMQKSKSIDDIYKEVFQDA